MAALTRHPRSAFARRNVASLSSTDGLLRLFCCLSAALVVCVSLAVLALRLGGDWTLGGLIVLLTIFILFTSLLMNASAAIERTAIFIAFIYMILFYLIPGFFHVSLGQFPFYSMNYPSQEIVVAALVVLIFTIALLVGYWAATRVRSEESSYERSRMRVGPQDAGIFYPCVLAVISLAIALQMGISYVTTPLGDIQYTFSPLLLSEIAMARILSFIGFAFALAAFYHRRGARTIGVAVITFAVFVILNSPLAIARYVLFSYLIILIVTFSNLINRRKIIFLCAFFLAEITIFPAISILSRGDAADLFTTSFFDYFISSGDFDGFQSTINVVMYVEKEGLKWGLNLLSALLFFVPRDWWPGKSIGTGGESAAFVGYDFINVSSPLPSEFYVDFGFIGVVLGGALVGALLAYVDRSIREARRTRDYLGMLKHATVVGYLFILLRGSLVGVIGPFVLSYGIMVVTARGAQFIYRVKTAKAVMGAAKQKKASRSIFRRTSVAMR